MDLSAPETWITLVSVVGGLSIAGLSLWFNYKERSSSHREFLYQKQVEAYENLFSVLPRISQPCLDYLADHGFRLNIDTRAEMRSMFIGLMKKWIVGAPEDRGWFLLPKVVVDEVYRLETIIYSITAPESDMKKWPPEFVFSKKPYGLLMDAENRVYNAVRRSMGVEPLSRQIRKVVGEPEA